MAPPERLGQYELLERIGAGGMAEVYRSRYHGAAGSSRRCVVKRMLPFPDEDRAQMEALFVSEARLSMQLTHGNIVQVFDFGQHEGSYFLVMELVEGITLADALDARGALPPQLVTLVMIEVLRGLHYAHTRNDERDRPLNIVHRDLSPDNILLGRDGQVKLTDFGIARASMSGRSKTDPGIFKGKMSYASPEQLRADPLDVRADVYGCGMTLWTCVTGVNPQEEIVLRLATGAAELPDPASQLPFGLANIVGRATAFDPLDRTPNAQELRLQLATWLEEQGMPFREQAVANLVQLVLDGPEGVEPRFINWLERAKPLQVITQPNARAVSPAALTKESVPAAKHAPPLRKGPLVMALGVGALVVGGVVFAALGTESNAPDVEATPVPLPALTAPPPMPAPVKKPAPVAAPVLEAPLVKRSAPGVPQRLTLNSTDFGFDVSTAGLHVVDESPTIQLVRRGAPAGFLFSASREGGPLRLLSSGGGSLAVATDSRLFLLGTSSCFIDPPNFDLSFVTQSGGKRRSRTQPRVRSEATVFVDERRYTVSQLDPRVRYQVSVTGPAGAQVLVVGDAAPFHDWREAGEPSMTGVGPDCQRIVTPGSMLSVKGLRGLSITMPRWPAQAEYEVSVLVQQDPVGRIKVDKGNTEALRMDAERRRLERSAPVRRLPDPNEDE